MFAPCNGCKRAVSMAEIQGYSDQKEEGWPAARSWWFWQVEGWCRDCTQLEYEIALEEEGVIKDGC